MEVWGWGGAGTGNFFNKAIVLQGGGTSVNVVKLSGGGGVGVQKNRRF